MIMIRLGKTIKRLRKARKLSLTEIARLSGIQLATLSRIENNKMVLNDIYTYFDCLNKGFEFRYVASAKVYYQLPSNIKDYLSQFKRFCVGSARMSKIFGNLYEKEYAIPKKRFYTLMLSEFLEKPVHCIFIYVLNFIGRQIAKGEIRKMDAKWQVVSSTKTLSPIC